MLITETTVLTSVSADSSANLPEIASRAAVTLALGATHSLTQATLTSNVDPNGAARSTIRELHPERASVSITVNTVSHQLCGSSQQRVLVTAMIVVAAESISCSQDLTSTLLASVPNRMVRPTVVIRAPRREQPTVRVDGSAWREIYSWKRARP